MSVLSEHTQEISSHSVPFKRVQGTVRWFDAHKGYGFLSMDNSVDDVLVSQDVLREYGLKTLRLGTVLNCEIIKSAKGLMATKIVDVLEGIKTGLDTLNHEMHHHLVEENLKLAIVKWYDDRKGYGFAVTHDDKGDILLSRNVLRQCGIRAIFPGDKIRIHVMDGERGLIADHVEYI